MAADETRLNELFASVVGELSAIEVVLVRLVFLLQQTDLLPEGFWAFDHSEQFLEMRQFNLPAAFEGYRIAIERMRDATIISGHDSSPD